VPLAAHDPDRVGKRERLAAADRRVRVVEDERAVRRADGVRSPPDGARQVHAEARLGACRVRRHRLLDALARRRERPLGDRVAGRRSVGWDGVAVERGGDQSDVEDDQPGFEGLPDDRRDGAFGGPTAAGVENAVVTGSLTKFFGLGDLRLGWLVADREFVEAARRVAFHLPSVAGTSRALAMRALYGAEALAERKRDLLAANARLLAEFVEASPAVSGTVPSGSSFAFLGHELVDGDELVTAAGDEGVLVVPGRFFGDPQRVRVSLGHAPEEMETALATLAAVAARLG